MKVQLLPTEERVSLGATHRIQVFASDLTQSAVNTPQTLALLNIPAGAVVRNVFTRTQAQFCNSADPAFNTTAVTLGDAGTANLFLSDAELNKNGAGVRFKAGTGTQKGYDADDVLNATFNSMAAKSLNSLDSGELWVFLELIDASTYDGALA